jgi:hypothetical protein
MAHGRERFVAPERQAPRSPSLRPVPLLIAPWHLDLGRVGQHQLAIEQVGRESVLSFDPPLGGTDLSLIRVAIVQPGALLDLHPWRTPARSLNLPWPAAPLDDLWLLLCTTAHRYWLEVPYGVCRSPGEHRHAPQLGPPRSPPDAEPDDIVLPWQTIRFKLGQASGWQLVVLARYGCAGDLELVAHRSEPGIPPAITLSASAGPRALAIEPHESWGAEPASLHVARYRFLPPSVGARAQVRLFAKSGAATLELHLPTSLTDRAHRSTGWRQAVR